MSRPLLNRRFVLEAAETQPDGHGGVEETWTPLGTLWGELRGVSGRDRERSEVALSQAGYRITVRASPFGAEDRPQAGQRLREGPRMFEILAVVDRDERGRWLTCYCREEAVR